MSSAPDLRALRAHYLSMPPVAAMDLRIEGYDGRSLCLQAPLALHVNDKGCAFGGSMASLMTLASWGLVTLQVEAAGLQADVFVADSQIRYLAPLFGDLHAESTLDENGDWSGFIATLRARGRARATLVSRVPLPEGGVAAEFRARYVAIVRKEADGD